MGLFDFLKKNPEKKEKSVDPMPQMADLDENPLQDGDVVEVLRYDLGKCRLIQGEHGFEYESLTTGERVSWLRMIDAATQLQKVKKVKG